MLLTGVTFADDLSSGWLQISGDQISGRGQGQAPEAAMPHMDARGLVVLPGFIDVHVHGAAGHDTMDATSQALTAMAKFFPSTGVTAFLPTTVTASQEAISRALINVAAYQQNPHPSGARVLGVHLEGPYINLKAKGAQDGGHVRLAHPAEYEPWLALKVIRLLTLAPEFAENLALLAACQTAGVAVSVGHTQATYEQAMQAYAAGARGITHTFNAMTGLHHRQPGVVGAALSNPGFFCELIADGVHVHPAAVQVLWSAVSRLILITDAMQGAGMPDGPYMLGALPVQVANGVASLANGTLAGSVLTMDKAVQNMRLFTEAGWPALMAITSGNAAAHLGLPRPSLLAGATADLVLLNDQCQVQATFIAGRLVYQVPRQHAT
jgi:N-acetylglucosamine-6-phosphate deacetylase